MSKLCHILCFPAPLLLLMLPSWAMAACAPMKIGYSNQEVVPYYLGSGPDPATPPGASVELLRELAASAGCGTTFSRLPPARIPASVDSGALNAAPLGTLAGEFPNIVYPRDKQGKPDPERAVQMHTVVYVRASDKLDPATDPLDYFKRHKLGTFHGASFAAILRTQGFEIDDGALDAHRNFEKLKLRRVDGVILSLAHPGDMDSFVAERYGGEIVRLDKPLRTAFVWLGVNRAYYEANRNQVDAMWTWLGNQGRVRLGQLLRQYNHNPSQQ